MTAAATAVQVNVTTVSPHRFVRLTVFEAITGTTARAAQEKIRTGIWIEGREYIRAPDGHIHIDMKGYDRWLQKERGHEA
jgi:hypothetical protein